MNDENRSPFAAQISMSLSPSEPPSSPLISNSFLYNLPDPTLGIPTTSAPAARLDILPSPYKRSAIASLNTPLSQEQTRQLQSHKENVARAAHHIPASAPPRSSPSTGSTSRLQANLDAPGGLPTPPSSSEALTTTPRASNQSLAALPREPVSPSPSRSRTAVLSPARASPQKPSRSTSTPRSSQRTSSSRRVLGADDNGGSDDDDDDHFLRSTGSQTPKRMQPLKELEEASDEDEQEEEEEIQLVSFKRGGPDATFIREIKENGWDLPMPPSPIKFTYLEPAAPRPPRQSSVGARARSQSRSKTPQIRASPAPSHASTSRASNRARSVRASSAAAAAAADDTNDVSDESIKSSGSVLTHTSRVSQARSKRSNSSRRSVARSSVAPPVVVADLTRDHPSLPDSPGDDPLLLIGPDTYIVYHDQTPSAKNRSTSRIQKGPATQADTSASMLSHSTPLPSAADAASKAMPQRRDSSSSVSSSASRSSLYERMSGRQAADVTADTHDNDDGNQDQDESQRTEQANHTFVHHGDEQGMQQQVDDGVAFLPFDDAGFASDSDADEPAPIQEASSSPQTPPLEGEQRDLEDISSMSDVSRSFADDAVDRQRHEVSGPVDVSAVDLSQDEDESALVDQSLHVGFVNQSLDTSRELSGSQEVDAEEQRTGASEGDQTMDTSGANHSANVGEELSEDDASEEINADITQEPSEEVTGEISEALSASQQSLDVSIADTTADTDGVEESADVSTVDQSVIVHAVDQSIDASMNSQSLDATADDSSAQLSNSDQSADTSASLENQEASITQDDIDASVALSDAVQADTTHGEAALTDESVGANIADTSAVADATLESEAAQSSELSDLTASSDALSASREDADDSRAMNTSRCSGDASPFEHDLSVSASFPDKSVANVSQADASIVDQSTASPHESVRPHVSTLPSESGTDSINIDLSFAVSEQGSAAIAPAVDGSLLPHPVVLIESLPEDSSAIMAWKAHQLHFGSDASAALTVDIDPSSYRGDEADVSMADASVSMADHRVDERDDVEMKGSGMPRSESISSVLSALSSVDTPEQEDQNEEAMRQKYQSSRDSVAERRTTLVRRLSLSTDSEHESDVEEHGDNDVDDDRQDADDGSQRADASTVQGRMDDEREDVEDEEDEEEEEEEEEGEEERDESSISDEASSSGEEHSSEVGQVDGEDFSSDEEELDDGVSSTHSQLDQDEQSASLQEPVVILSSSASPSGVAASALGSEDEQDADEQDEEDEEDEEEEYVIQVVRDSRDRSVRRRSEHSAISADEPHIHTLHLRQPGSPSSHTLADASHSRSRVLKLTRPTSTPIVEISSLDPRAAARATAILKLFHKYVDEGWISGAELGDATEGRMRRVVDAIQRAEGQGRGLEDVSADGGDLTTLLMDAELSLAREREGTVDTESFLGSRAASVQAAASSPATPFLPGGFRGTPANARVAAARSTPSAVSTSGAASRTTFIRDGHDSTSTVGSFSRRRSQHRYDFPDLSTPDRTARHRPPKQARLSSALAPPSSETLNPRTWDTKDWVRLDKYFTSGVKRISSHLLSSAGTGEGLRESKANAYMDALSGISVEQVAELFLDEMEIAVENRVAEWTEVKVEQRVLALQRKYLRKVEAKYPQLAHREERGLEEEDEAEEGMATEDLDWSMGNTTAATTQKEKRGRVSFGTPYRMGAHSTPAVGLLKKATSRAAEHQGMYPPLPTPSSTSTSISRPDTGAEAHAEGVITKATKLISRLSGSFGGLLASPRPLLEGKAKGKRKATEAELEASPRIARRRLDDSGEGVDSDTSTQAADSTVDSILLDNTTASRMRSTINASMYTNATSIVPDTSWRDTGKSAAQTQLGSSTTTVQPPRIATSTVLTRAAPTQPRLGSASTTISQPQPPRAGARGGGGGGRGLTSSLQLAGGSSGVSHTPLSLLSPGTHRVAARKVDELRQSRADRNWTSPRRQRALGHVASASAAVGVGGGGGGGVGARASADATSSRSGRRDRREQQPE